MSPPLVGFFRKKPQSKFTCKTELCQVVLNNGLSIEQQLVTNTHFIIDFHLLR